MEAEVVLKLFDSLWFSLNIFENQSPISALASPNPNLDPQTQQLQSKRSVSSQLSIHSRSKSDEFLYTFSPSSVLKPHLRSVISDRELSLEIPKPPQFNVPGEDLNKMKKRFSKSLSELEFEEVKGFMDLGFVFSEEDKESSLVEIIPGLQRLGQKTENCGGETREESRSVEELIVERARRPYLSEAWGNSNYRKREETAPLMKWRVPAVSNEIDMKDSLKWWAHTVASAVR